MLGSMVGTAASAIAQGSLGMVEQAVGSAREFWPRTNKTHNASHQAPSTPPPSLVNRPEHLPLPPTELTSSPPKVAPRPSELPEAGVTKAELDKYRAEQELRMEQRLENWTKHREEQFQSL